MPGLKFTIGVDGEVKTSEVSAENAGRLVETGADILIAGSCVFNAADPGEMINQLLIIAGFLVTNPL